LSLALKDDGYDTSDYTGIHATYGTMRDFKAFLREAHRRGLRVIIELVLNHTSTSTRGFGGPVRPSRKSLAQFLRVE